ncbi:NAD(+) synthase [bacterium]|nr:NAD(+) synthase [bacterium]
MNPQLLDLLERFRAQRAFRAQNYLSARLCVLDNYFRQAGIRAAVVGLSGGIDSAVVLALLVRAAAMPGTPLRKVVPALIPMFVEAGASNQDTALARGREVAAAFGLEGALVDLSGSLETMKAAVDQGYGRVGLPWATGQLVSYIRTPALYYLTALLTEDEMLAVLCGTTNRDEGAYIGFFGKASDGMVDLQPISDLHKSEVRQLAHLLGVPASVIEATPTGDTYDGRPDEAMIGAPYDFLELYEHWLCAGKPQLRLDRPATAQWNNWAAALEELHGKNLHKYLAGSVAVHLDILERPVPGGWRSEVYGPWAAGPDPSGKLVGEFPLSSLPLQAPSPTCHRLLDFGDACLCIDDLLSPQECAQIYHEVLSQAQIPVGVHGRTSDEVRSGGSTRATAHSPVWAAELWRRLAAVIPQLRVLDELSSTDHGGHPIWRAVGVNPVLRFICYRQGGQLVPHYDAGFDFQDGRRFTLMSMVVYLNTLSEDAGGQTRFLRDTQRGLPVNERNHEDWERPAKDSEILTGVRPVAGRALLFDHRLLHDGQPYAGQDPRLLLRTDIIFERCGLLPGQSGQPAPELKCLGPTKLQADPFYGPLTGLIGVDGAEEAGYFEDSRCSPKADPRADTDWLCTPTFKARNNLAGHQGRPLAVLLTTGALCPVHPGHLEMMEQAKLALEKQGVCVLGGYLSPSHDEYVMGKCGHQVPSAAHRLHLCRQAVLHSDWLMVDEWEALHTSAALNFSDVLERLSAYLNRHLACAQPIRVYYVFGSDNARFSLTFVQRGQAICVERPGFTDRLNKYAAHPLLRDNPRVTFLRGVNLPDVASTQVRQGDFGVLTPPVRALWQDWQDTQPGTRPTRLFLRDEGEWAVQHWAQRLGAEALQQACRRFMDGVGEAVQQGFRQARLPDPPSPLDLCVLSIQEQRQGALHRAQGASILSLDPCMPGAYNLGVSRCFELCANEIRPGLVARPGWPALDRQLAAIPAGSYWLVDDDIATGHTMKEVIACLPEHCKIEHQEALCQLPDLRASGLVDLGDFRDFLLGSWEGGLVVVLPNGQLARVPYLQPYVNPADRLSLPISQSFAFSRRIWQLNLEFFQQFGLTLGDTPPAFRQLTDYLGLPHSLSLAEWCRWHLARMAETE